MYHRYEGKIGKYWNSIKICIRNGYIIDEADIWLDQVGLLSYFGKDVRSPRYICFKDSEDLHLQHNRLTEKKQAILDKQAFQERIKRVKNENKAYIKAKGKYFGIVFKSGNLQIRVLESIEEIIAEGKAMHHCVYASNYHEKANSLIMSASRSGERLETIEFDLKKLELVQARGLQNQSSAYHDQIITLIEKNIEKIRKVRDRKEQKKGKSQVMHTKREAVAI